MHSQSSDQDLDPNDSDPLAAVIRVLRPQTVLSKVIAGAGRWAVRYEAHEEPGFCLMLEGTCTIDVDGVGVLDLEAGDFLLLPATPGFTMGSDLSVKPTRGSATHTGELRHGTKTGPPSMRQLGGYFRFDRANAPLLRRLLPSSVVVRRDDPSAGRIHRLVELIAEETSGRRPGRDLILARLVEVLLVEVLRFRPDPGRTAQKERGLLAGLDDPALARALRRIHEDVAHPWTVATLARAAGMSRAVFAERFHRMVGMPPMQYLLEWRIAIAKDALRRERARLAEIAEKVGYQSASAFSTAFTRHEGIAPSAFARAEG